MQIIKVHFGGTKPQDMEYLKQADGMAEVWLYNNIREEIDADGNTEFVADGVMLKTCLSAEEIEARRDSYFDSEEESTLEERIASLETEIASLKSYVNSIGKTELVGEGTADNPFTLTNGMELVPNAYYNYNGTRYAYMGSAEKWDGSDLSFENGWAEF